MNIRRESAKGSLRFYYGLNKYFQAVLLFLLLFSIEMLGQNQDSFDKVYKSGNLILEFWKVVKGEKSAAVPDCSTIEFCLENGTQHKLQAVLHSKKVESQKSLTIPPQATSCLLELSPGVYHYYIRKEGELIEEADILLEDCRHSLSIFSP